MLYCILFSFATLLVSVNAGAQPAISNGASAGAKTTSGVNPSAIAPTIVAPSLEISNLFDSQRKAWPDRIPPPAPPPPPPPPTPVSDADLQLYGVVIVGSIKRATVKMGPRFANASTPGRAFSNLVEGQALGEFTVSQISPTYVTLSAPGGQQQIYFTKKTDRAGGSAIAVAPKNVEPVQAATETSVTDPSQNRTAAAQATAVPGHTATADGSNALASRNPAAPAAAAAPASKEGVAPPAPVDIQNSLAAAIAAARANASNRPPPANSLNPFMQQP